MDLQKDALEEPEQGCVKKIAEFQLCYMLHTRAPSYSTEKKRETFHGAKIKATCGETEKRNNDA